MIILCGMASAACAGQQVVTLWPEGKTPLKTSDAPEKVVPAPANNPWGWVSVQNVNAPSLTVFLAKDTGKPNPAVMVCPGGGYGFLAFDVEGTEVGCVSMATARTCGPILPPRGSHASRSDG